MIRKALALAVALTALAAGPAAAGVVEAEIEAARNEAEVARTTAVDASRNEVEAELSGAEVGSDNVAVVQDAADVDTDAVVVAPIGSGNTVVAPITAPITVAPDIECSVLANCSADNSIRDSFNRDESIRDSFNEETCTGYSCNSVRESSSVIVLAHREPCRCSATEEIVLTGSKRRISATPDYSEKTLPLTGIDWLPWLAFALAMISAGAGMELFYHRKEQKGGGASKAPGA